MLTPPKKPVSPATLIAALAGIALYILGNLIQGFKPPDLPRLQAISTVPGGTSDDTAALQAALAAVTPGSTVTLAPGTTYTFRQPLVALGVPFTLDAEGATLVYAGADGTTALTLGNAAGSKTADTFGPRFVVRGLSLRTTLPRAGNAAVGLCLQNVYGATVERFGAACFGTGIELIGDGTGCTYSTLSVRQMIDNGTHLHVVAKNSGFVSEWNITGPGHFSYNGIFANKPCTHVLTETDGTANTVVSSLRFLGCCFEGQDSHCAVATVKAGRYLHWLDCRYETAPGQKMPLTLAPGTAFCVLLGNTTPMVSWQDGNGGVTGNLFLPGWH